MAPADDDLPLIGRTAELARVAAVFARRPAHGVVLAGPGGSGKTRLALAALEQAATNGTQTASIRGSATTAPTPFAALTPLLGSGDDHPAPAVDRLRRAADAVDRLATGGPAVLFVDDAQLLDAASAATLHAVASRRAVSLLVAVRTGDDVSDAIVAMWKDGLAERVEVGPLDRADTDSMARSLLGGPLDGAGHRDLWQASLGNPLFVRELLLGALDAGVLRESNGVWRFATRPTTWPRLIELLAARLAGLSPAERDALDVLTVAGELGLGLLTSLTDATALVSLERRRLVEVVTDGRRRPVRFAHPLYGEQVRAGLAAPLATAIHRRLADATEATGARRRADVVQVAVWRAEGGGTVQPALMVEAASRLLQSWDEEGAIRLARAARDAGAGVDADLIEAQSLLHLGRFDAAADLLTAASGRAHGDAEVTAAALRLSVPLFWALGREEGARELLLDAHDRVCDIGLRGELNGQLATYDALAYRPADALARVETQLDEPPGRAFLAAAVAAVPALTVSGRSDDAQALAGRAITAQLAVDDPAAPFAVYTHLMSRIFALGELGHLRQARDECTYAYDLAVGARALPGQAWGAMLLGRNALLEGRVGAASEWFAEAAALFEDLREDGLRRWCLAGRILTAAMRRDAAGASHAAVELEAVAGTAVRLMEVDVDRAHTWARLVDGQEVEARRILREAAADADARGAFGMALTALHDLARLGDAEAAEAAAAAMSGAHRSVQGPLAAARVAFIDAVAGGNALAADLACTQFTALGAALFAAEAAAFAASTYRAAGARREAEQAATRARALAAICEGAATPALATAPLPPELTTREREVATLAASGASSSAIAAELHVSVRTVENHLQRAYTKLSVRNRTELAASLIAGG